MGRLNRLEDAGRWGDHSNAVCYSSCMGRRRPPRPVELPAWFASEFATAELKDAWSARASRDMWMNDDLKMWLAQLADFVTRLRTPVPREHKTREVTGPPLITSSERLVKEFKRFVKGLATVRGYDCPGDDEVKALERVAFDSIPAERLQVAKEIGRWRGGRGRHLIPKGMSKSVTYRVLEDMRLLGLVEHSSSYGYVAADDYRLLFGTISLPRLEPGFLDAKWGDPSKGGDVPNVPETF